MSDHTKVAHSASPRKGRGEVGHRGFRSNAWLITDEEGRMLYGSYAYVYKKDWWDKIVEKEQEKDDEEED